MNEGRSAMPASRMMSNAASASARVWPFSRLASTTSLSDSTAETTNAQPVRMSRAVEEVGVAERDVSRAGGDEAADVAEHDVLRHDEESSVVDGRNGAV